MPTDESKTTSGEDIGRPGPWGEGRYQKPGQPLGDSVKTPPGSVNKNDKTPISTPVTKRDYEGTESDPSGGAG